MGELPDLALRLGQGRGMEKPMTPEEIVRIRRALGLSQSGLALRIGVVKGTVSAWEQGRSRCRGPAALALAALAEEGRDRLRAELKKLPAGASGG